MAFNGKKDAFVERPATPGSGSSSDSSDQDDTSGVRLADFTPPDFLCFRGRLNMKKGTNALRDSSPVSPTRKVGKSSDDDIFFSSPPVPKSPANDSTESKTLTTTEGLANELSAALVVTMKQEPPSPAKAPIENCLVHATSALSLRAKPSMVSTRHQIGEKDAQGIYPPTACVFVANLPEGRDDQALEAAVTRVFSEYGVVYVKIRRDARNMPFAFCQYTNDEHAKNAVKGARNELILGRACRTEMAKANRNFVVWKRNGGNITVEEARQIVEPYGALNKCEMLPNQVRETMGISEAVLVEFATFDPTRDFNSAVRHNKDYHIDALESKKRNMPDPIDADAEFLKQYEINRRSIYISGLPVDANMEEVINFFSVVGDIEHVDIINRGGDIPVFAFVEFARADQPDIAIERFQNACMRGKKIHIERKFIKTSRVPYRVKSQFLTAKTSIEFGKTNAVPQTPTSRRYPVQQLQQQQSSVAMAPPAPMGPMVPLMQPPPAVSGPGMHPGMGQPFMVLPSPTNAQPNMFGYGSVPPSPSPYPYPGGFWPGMTPVHDPATGNTYFVYNPPVLMGAETPTRHGFGQVGENSNGI
ncbi:hypothetical protein B0T19DRAFT_396519 [Cercophora scortea]|uniref:RRM domain-containing protein n=1 Tax=Cercophora scortea TaxID=314031 RepID=A0AAE0MLR1_9PEZI|nr:hypothetical protein B0T19DRAFT_396519 [Cercophora scortea]